jgi:hypothetical protein
MPISTEDAGAYPLLLGAFDQPFDEPFTGIIMLPAVVSHPIM